MDPLDTALTKANAVTQVNGAQLLTLLSAIQTPSKSLLAKLLTQLSVYKYLQLKTKSNQLTADWSEFIIPTKAATLKNFMKSRQLTIL